MLSYGEFFIKIKTCYQIYLFLYGFCLTRHTHLDPCWWKLLRRGTALSVVGLSASPVSPWHLNVVDQAGKVGIGPVTDLPLTIGLDSPVLSQRLMSDVVLRRNKVGDQ